MKNDIGKIKKAALHPIPFPPLPFRTAFFFFLFLYFVCCLLSYEGVNLECKTDEGINEQQSKQSERAMRKGEGKLEYASSVAAKCPMGNGSHPTNPYIYKHKHQPR